MGYYIFTDNLGKATIYLPITEDQIPEGWDDHWNDFGGTVVWGYAGN